MSRLKVCGEGRVSAAHPDWTSSSLCISIARAHAHTHAARPCRSSASSSHRPSQRRGSTVMGNNNTAPEFSISAHMRRRSTTSTAPSKNPPTLQVQVKSFNSRAKSDKLTQKMKLKKNSMYLMHLVQPATAMVAR